MTFHQCRSPPCQKGGGTVGPGDSTHIAGCRKRCDVLHDAATNSDKMGLPMRAQVTQSLNHVADRIQVLHFLVPFVERSVRWPSGDRVSADGHRLGRVYLLSVALRGNSLAYAYNVGSRTRSYENSNELGHE